MARTRNSSRLPEILHQHEGPILADWVQRQLSSVTVRRDLINEAELQRQSREFLAAFARAASAGALNDMHSPQWGPVRDLLTTMSRARAIQGFSAGETATFVFSLKEPLFKHLAQSVADVGELADETWTATTAIDALGLFATEAYQKSREEVIARQQRELLELSTPVVTLWDGILALPLIGTLDSARTQVVMENLLERIVATGSNIAILDITGVPTVDTLVAQHLLKTVAAARLMGADCIISGIRPQIAQTIVHLGVDLNAVTTKATLADAFKVAMSRLGLAVTRNGGAGARGSGQAAAQSEAPNRSAINGTEA
jgi:rsbT co-antagonist protein RsbR